MTMKPLEPTTDTQTLVTVAAFRLLLDRAKPVAPEDIASYTGICRQRIAQLLDLLDSAGRVRRDAALEVVGAGGLSVVPDRHAIELDGRPFWTWCAYDIVGIFGALGASGRASSPSPTDGEPILVNFTKGRPEKNDAVLFRPDEELMTCCDNVYEEWCPNSNLFASAELAAQWAHQRGLHGRVLDLEEASDLATESWRKLV